MSPKSVNSKYFSRTLWGILDAKGNGDSVVSVPGILQAKILECLVTLVVSDSLRPYGT